MSIFKQVFFYSAVFLMGMMMISCSLPDHPSDDKLISSLKQNKTDFERLCQRFKEDSNLAYIGTRGKGGKAFADMINVNGLDISAARKKEYLTLLSKLDLISMGTTDKYPNKEVIFFNISRIGGAVGGSMKRYVWFAKDNASQDDVKSKSTEILSFNKIDDHWYLLYEQHS